jgi:hypothetical protein
MKKVLFIMMLLAVATTAIKAQKANATLLQPAGSYIYYGDQAFNLRQCAEFLSTSIYQPAYEKFQSGYKCYQAGWGLFGAGLGMDLIGSIIIAFSPKEGSAAMLYSGVACLGVGAAAILASVPTLFIGYARLDDGIDMFNHAQAAATSQAYWTIQGSQNGIGLALHF